MTYNQGRTAALAGQMGELRRQNGIRAVVRHLGATVVERSDEDCRVAFGFWLPGFQRAQLRLYRALDAVDPGAAGARARFKVSETPLTLEDEFGWVVMDHLREGDASRMGDLYRVVAVAADDLPPVTHRDPLASSVPFGASGPAEVYDIERLWAGRTDADYLEARIAAADIDPELGVPRLPTPTNILQIHVPTATSDGTFAGLTRLYRELGRKLSSGESLTPLEESISEYDAVQLMPIEPTIEYEGSNGFWVERHETSAIATDGPPERTPGTADYVTVDLRRPDMTNWGYDVMTVASPALNPALLERGRPEEFVELLETLHGMPGGGIRVILDIVYGHADNQSAEYLLPQFIAGPGMYGLVLDYRRQEVREILLEMQRRKSAFGVDGLRVDGAQDFKYYDQEAGELKYDDDYLREMNNQVLEVNGLRYLPWMIFEDGRPWPDDDWELSSTYQEVTRILPNVYQWGPLTFAHNTPFLYTFWAQKWWRVREVFLQGGTWITGCSNHDTLRRGTQVDPAERINNRLGADLREVFRNAYNNAGFQLLTYAAMPGVPMDFLQANVRAPWSFLRNTDDRWAVKVVSEESRFLTWAVDEASYGRDGSFQRLKGYGFTRLELLRQFARVLDLAMRAADYHCETAATILDAAVPNSPLAPHRVATLKDFARAWMDDAHDYCNVEHWSASIDPTLAEFHAATRAFRRARPFLRRAIDPEHEAFCYLEPCEGSVVYAVLRWDPHSGEQLLTVVNMEGHERRIELREVLESLQAIAHPVGAGGSHHPDWDRLQHQRWTTVLVTPATESGAPVGAPCPPRIVLANAEGFVAAAGYSAPNQPTGWVAKF